MAKGDPKRAQNLIDYGRARGETLGENLRIGTLEPQLRVFQGNYANAAAQQQGDYNNIMSGYNEFANTGGFSPEDIGAIRARSVSPVRAMYANAQRDINRQRALQGGYSPGFGVLRARMAREGSQAAADATTNAEAGIAQLRQQGRLAGLSGAASLYGTTPGMTSMFGNQVINATGQLQRGVENEMDFPYKGIAAQINKGNMKGGVNWDAIAKGAGTAALIAASDRNLKKDIKPASSDDILNKYKKLPIFTWKYKDGNMKHIGPMAQDFKRIFKLGDGKTISLIDTIGTTLALNKAIADKA